MEAKRQASETNFTVPSHDVSLAKEKKMNDRIYSIATDDWGQAIIFDLAPKVEPVPTSEVFTEKNRRRRSLHASKSTEFAATSKAVIEEIDDEKKIYCLPFFQASMMATIIEDTITELRILGECNNVIRIEKALHDMPILLKIKYGVKFETKDPLESVNPHKLNCLEYKINKLQSDRENISNMFSNLYVELSTEKSCTEIVNYIGKVYERQNYGNQIREDEAKNKMLRKELIKQLRIQRNHHKTIAYEADNLTAKLLSDIEDAEIMMETKGRHFDNWQGARTEQHELVILETEKSMRDSTFYFKRRSEHESRVHSEVESLTNIVITETLEKIEVWMKKYEKDMEEMDLKVQIQKSEYLKKLDKRQELENLFASRQLAMKNWREFTSEREKQREYERRMTNSAITVQAWWRGLLVRKQLGPYKPKNKKKGKK